MAELHCIPYLFVLILLINVEQIQCQEPSSLDIFNDTAEFVDCGGHIYAGHGYFESPGFPDVYPNNIDCVWSITTREKDTIRISSEYFFLEDQPECSWDYLEIRDNMNNAPIPWKYCGEQLINYTSTSNSLTVNFHTDSFTQNAGFRLKYDVIRGAKMPDYCNKTIEKNCYITSPNYPLPYLPDTYCYYHIQASPGYRVQIKFVDFHVEIEPCVFDVVTVYDRLPTGRKQLASLCGKNAKGPFQSTFESLLMVLESDNTLQTKGFNASIEFIPLPNFSKSWTTQSETTSLPVISTESTTLSKTLKKTSTTAQTSTSTPKPTTRAPTTTTATTTTMTTTTEAPVTSPYDIDCSYVYINKTGSISSPGYPDKYSHNKLCNITLDARELSFIVVQFTEFDIEASEHCSYDRLLFSPEGVENLTNSVELNSVSLCGNDLENKILTFESRSLSIIFKSDTSVNDKGYLANYFITPVSAESGCTLDCKNGATCMKKYTEDNIPVWNCICPPDHHGELCDEKHVTCLTHHCHHDGKCIKDGDDVRCQCEPGFSGEFCELKVPNGLWFVKKPQNTSVARGSSVLLECSVNDNTADITWLHRDRILSRLDNNNGINIYPGGVLLIPDIKETHEGQYTCAVISSGAWIETSAWLSLVGPCHLEVSKLPENITREVGDEALFECIVPGATSIVWHKDGDIVFPTNRKSILVNDYLMIRNLVEPDAGVYTCAASGENGCFAKKSATLTIKETGHNEFCGRPVVSASIEDKFRIASGREAKDGSAPWHVTIIENTHGTAYCGGSLINENWVLTAAHCVSQFEEFFRYKFETKVIEMFFGTIHCNGQGGVSRKLKDYILYPSYHGTDFNDDIALFQLDEPVTFGDMIMPICLEKETFTNELLKSGKAGIITGCGSRYERGRPPKFLHEVTIPYVPREVCAEKARAVNASFTSGMICAGYARSMRGDACSGDSGGPYTMQFKGRWVLVGIVSWGVGCDRANQYGYYTHISRYFDWIMSISSDKQRI
ncbi:uncharacterized protein LOC126828601 isoform X1 [Patella vulgata]|uniref:uncharacterized protein LOC126828601 isoform X1 n=1 Tax=Patella vulgata TaxID=6465 RepID=UPI0021804B55|nr:uncharacterized protein LOC126828601 isoform X1 [Patella vulgata]